MKTVIYNPSPLELELTEALAALQPEIEARLKNQRIIQIDQLTVADNPMLLFNLMDSDGDAHEIVVQIIQRPDMPASAATL